VDLQVSARDSSFFGPGWAQELLSLLRLYDFYVLHALPKHFARTGLLQNSSDVLSGQPRQLRIAVVAGDSQSVDLATAADLVGRGVFSDLPLLWLLFVRFAAACGTVGLALACGLFLSAFLRRFAILSIRMQVYSAYNVRQMRRYAFIAEPLRRINCYSSGELLELWTAWAASAGLAAWLLWKAFEWGVGWVFVLLCYAFAEYWGVVHVRTLQSRWLYPRATGLIFSGVLVYATWWPRFPTWILVWSLLSAQLWLICTLLCSFDCYVTLPEQPPHRLLYRSILLPAAPLSRDQQAVSSAAASADKEPQTSSQSSVHAQFLNSAKPAAGPLSGPTLRPPPKMMISRGTQTVDDPNVIQSTDVQVPLRPQRTAEAASGPEAPVPELPAMPHIAL